MPLLAPKPLKLVAQRTSGLLPSPGSETPTPSPQEHLSPPQVTEALPIAQLQVQRGSLTTTRPTPSPPFRLMPPSTATHSRSPSPGTQPRGSVGTLNTEMTPPVSPTRAWVHNEHHRQTEMARIRDELRSRSLIDSAPGRMVVHLLTYPWVWAPSGLATMLYGAELSEEYAQDCARHINDLACGAVAYISASAGVLAVHNLQGLNRLLVRSGISPIAPTPAPGNWLPLAARRPPEFLLEAFRRTPSPSPAPTPETNPP